jgi:hypothetical protein
MKFIPDSRWSRAAYADWRRAAGPRRRAAQLSAGCFAMAVFALVGCAPPTDVIELRAAPQATKDAMLQIRILPLGAPAPAGAGAISPVSGFGCGQTVESASGEAVRQLQAKALRLHATAVMDVLIGPSDLGTCIGHGMIANGMAVGLRGLPSSL